MKPSLFNKIDCIRIPVKNLEDGLDFYSRKLGHQLLWKTESAVGLQLDEDKSEIVLYTEPEGLEIDFQVDDVQQAVKEFVQAGGEIVTGPFDIPIGKCVVVRDPWENQFVILDASKGTFETDEHKQVVGLKN
ncbi:MAG: VOC family protein [Candidatus Thorarchaeota archaeon]